MGLVDEFGESVPGDEMRIIERCYEISKQPLFHKKKGKKKSGDKNKRRS